MATVTHKGNTVRLAGELPAVGSKAPEFQFVQASLAERNSAEYTGKVRVIITIPSIDTGICAIETRKFNEKLAIHEGKAAGIVISQDLPFALGRFCAAEGISNMAVASDFRYRDFADKYQVTLTEGALKGLMARAVFVVDQQDVIRYVELVPEIAQEPDYDKALAVVESLL